MLLKATKCLLNSLWRLVKTSLKLKTLPSVAKLNYRRGQSNEWSKTSELLVSLLSSHRPQKALRTTGQWHCGSSGCTLALGRCWAVVGGRAPGPGRGSAQTWRSAGFPGSWTSGGPGWGRTLPQLRRLRSQEKNKRVGDRDGGVSNGRLFFHQVNR